MQNLISEKVKTKFLGMIALACFACFIGVQVIEKSYGHEIVPDWFAYASVLAMAFSFFGWLVRDGKK